jgi:hypothetical protein
MCTDDCRFVVFFVAAVRGSNNVVNCCIFTLNPLNPPSCMRRGMHMNTPNRQPCKGGVVTFVCFVTHEKVILNLHSIPPTQDGGGGEDTATAMRSPDLDSPPLSPSAEHTLSTSAEPASRVCTQPSLSADPFSGAVGFPGHRRAGEGGEDTAMILPADVVSPSLSSSAKPSSRVRAQPSLSADPFSRAVGFPGHIRAGEGGEDTAMMLPADVASPSLSSSAEPCFAMDNGLLLVSNGY